MQRASSRGAAQGRLSALFRILDPACSSRRLAAIRTLSCLIGALLVGFARAETAAMSPLAEDVGPCLMRKLSAATDAVTIGELRAACAAETTALQAPEATGEVPPILSQRLAAERDTFNNRYAITPHRANYVLLGSYSQRRPSNAAFSSDGDGSDRAQKIESKFQLSVKVPLRLGALEDVGDFFAGYTQRAFWQIYNQGASAPFRETNYEPELWFSRVVNQPVLGWNLSSFSLGLNHQSNGRGGPLSRSWNRVFGSAAFEHGGIAVVVRPWWRIPERRESDNNPDITHYLGYFDLSVLGHYGENVFDLMLRNNLKLQRNRGAMQLGWSFPLTPKLKGYVQWFYGFGESLVDYKVRQNALGAGVQLLDW